MGTVLDPSDVLNVSVAVSNVGGMAGKTVAALYFAKPLSSFVRYHKMLGTFAKTPLIQPGKSETVVLSLPVSAMSAYDPATKAQKVEAGQYVLTVGQDSVTAEGSLTITVQGAR